jgi:hypothetical protein
VGRETDFAFLNKVTVLFVSIIRLLKTNVLFFQNVNLLEELIITVCNMDMSSHTPYMCDECALATCIERVHNGRVPGLELWNDETTMTTTTVGARCEKWRVLCGRTWM